MPARRCDAVEAVEDVRQVLAVDARARGRGRAARRRARSPRPCRRAGSTWPRCRAGCRPRGRARPGAPRPPSARASVSKSTLGRSRRRARPQPRPRALEAHVLRLAPRARSPRASSTRSPTSVVISLELADDVGEQPLALACGSGRSVGASTSMFVRRLVSGVRSSCDASATSWRCAARERSSASSIALNARASRPARRRPRPRSAATGRAVARDPSSVASSAGAPAASAARATAQPSSAASAMPSEPRRRSGSSSCDDSALVDLVQRPRDLDRDVRGRWLTVRIATGGARAPAHPRRKRRVPRPPCARPCRHVASRRGSRHRTVRAWRS